MAESHFAWYSSINAGEPLEQGDLIDNFPVPEPDLTTLDKTKFIEGEKQSGRFLIKSYDLIVMTQSCDIPKLDDDDRIILCPRYDYVKLLEQHPEWKKSAKWEHLLKGQFIALHLLNKCEIEGHSFDYQVVSLREVFAMPFGFVKQNLVAQKERIRLLPPYREQLSQAFAKLFMRVGLPIDLPNKDPYGNS